MPLRSTFVRQAMRVQRETGKRGERPVRSPASLWFSVISRGVLLVVLGALLRCYLPPLKKALRPLFGMPLTNASHCLAGYHRFVPLTHGLSVCPRCNLVCACPYCLADIPAGVPFVNCAQHRDACIDLQDTRMQHTAGTLNGKRI